jgi:hypothetical protein
MAKKTTKKAVRKPTSVWKKDWDRLQSKLTKDPVANPPAPEAVAQAKAEQLRELLHGMTVAQIRLFSEVVLFVATPDQIIEYLLSRKISTKVWNTYLKEVPMVMDNA